jgi:two-component system, OmpR family, phosphate regulon sensor histidine kinase PhoR
VLDIRWKAGLTLSALCAICAFLWLISGALVALLVFSTCLLIYVTIHLYWLHQLHIWFKKPVIADIPEGEGSSVWEDVFASLLQYERSNKNNQNQLNSALALFNLATSAMPDGLVILDANHLIEWSTPNADTLLGLNIVTDKNLPIVNLVRNSDFIGYLYSNEYSEPFKLKSSRNADVTLEIQIIPFANQQKLLVCKDMTQLEKLDMMRRDFIANVSHELRTPLTVVAGFLETLGDMEGAVPNNIKRYFGMMQEQTSRMQRIIADLLTLSTIESNTENPSDDEIEISGLLNQIKNDAQGLSNSINKGRHRIHLIADTHINIRGSQEELLSAFSNLVSNAVRYTPDEGDIFINWQYNNNQAVFSVRDTGIGIEQQHIDRLTERFYRVDRGRSRETGGTGLGLAIVKHILNRHQARLEITSEIGIGSTFSIIFPSARLVFKDKKENQKLQKSIEKQQ